MPDQLDYDAAAAEVARQDDQDQPANPYLQAAAQVSGARRSILKSSLELTKGVNPDHRAKAMELAKAANLPVEMVEADLEGTAHAVRTKLDLDTLRKNHPDVAEWLSHPDRAAIASDDLQSLRQLDVAARSLRGEDPTGILPPGYLFDGDKIIRPIGDGSQAEVFDNLQELAKDLEARGEREFVREIQAETRNKEFADRFGWTQHIIAGMGQSMMQTQRAVGTRTEYDREGEEVVEASVANAPGWFGDVQRGVGGLIADAPLMLAGGAPAKGVDALFRLTRARAALSTVVGRTAAKRITTGAVVAGASQPLAIREGLAEGDEHGAADGALAWMVESAVPGAFGRTGVERIIVPGAGDVAAQGWRGAVKKLITDAGMEATEEAVTEWAHAVREVATGADPTALDPDKLWRRLTVAGAVGGVAGGSFSLPATIAEKFTQDGEEARRASTHAERLDRIVDLLAESKTNGRAPAEVAALMETTLGQAGAHTFVDADAFRAAFDDPVAAAAALGVAQEYTAALATGGQVQIPTVTLLQRAATDEQIRKLIPQARRAPTATTATEADEFQARVPEALRDLQAQAKAQATEGQADPLAAEAAEYEADMFRQLDKAAPATVDRGAIRDQAKLVTQGLRNLAKSEGKTIAEIVKLQVKGEFQRALKGEKFDLMDAMIERVRKQELPTDREVSGPSLVDFLRTKGLADKALAGELKQLAEDDRTRKPGERNLIRGPWEDAQGVLHQPIDLDTAAAYAHDRGYIDEATPAALLSALESEIGGTPVFNAAKYGNPEAEGIRESLQNLADMIREAGGDPSMSNKEIRKLLAEHEEKQGVEKDQPAYHGSPHRFDKFTTDHMGSGEGVQAYGWGLYFAGSKEVGKYYKDTLGKESHHYDGKPIDPKSVEFLAAQLLMGNQGDKAQTIDDLKAGGDGEGWGDFGFNTKQTVDAVEKMDPSKIEQGGRLYTVEIPDDGEYLLWDKPLKDQPAKVRKAIEQAFKKNRDEKFLEAVKKYDEGNTKAIKEAGWNIFDYPGAAGALYKRLAELTSPQKASRMLHAAGLPGIKYLDGMSRGKGEGSFNYVIFDGADAVITEYNQPGKKDRRASIQFTPGEGLGRKFTINLFKTADASSFLHESGHLFLELYADLAAAPGASDAIKAEHKRILDWLGAKDHASITEDMHEKFARGFERYLMEGVAPASNLRRAFKRIKDWMLAIYKSVTTLNVELTPEIRNVFDRLLAAEDGAIEVEREHGMDAPLPREVFASDEEYEAAAKAFGDSRQGTADRLAGDLLADLTEDRRQKLAAERLEVRADVTNQVDDRPVYQVIAMLQRGELPDGTKLPDEMQGVKLDRDDLVATWGEAVLKKLPGPGRKANGGPYVYANEGGQPVEQIARAWGFPSGDAMIEQMIEAADRDTTIEAETDAEMKRRHPDPMADLPDRARAALATDQRAELFRRELSALGRRAGQAPAPIEVLRQVARDRIAKEIAYKLAPDKHRIAAAKAARRVVDAVSRQEWNEAYRAKVQEALALELYRASRDAKEASEAGRAYLRGFDTIAKRERIGKAGGWEWTVYGPDGSDLGSYAKEAEAREAWTQQPQGSTYRRTNGYLEQIDAVLDGFQLRRASNLSLRRRDAFKAWLDRQANDGEPVDIDPKVIADLGNRNWTDLSVDEQSEVVNAIRNIETLANLKNKLLKSARSKDLDEARRDVVGAIVTNQPNALPDGQNDDLLTKAMGKMVGFVESHRKDGFLARRMDGDQDGGAVWDYLIRSRNEAAGEQETRSAKESVALAALFKAWGKKSGALLSDIPGTRMRMTLEQRIALALNWGNQQGRQRVMSWLGRGGWNAGDAQAVLDSLDKSDWKLVNGIIGQINSHWSDVAALEQKTKGIAPEKVEAVPFVTKAGVQPGGYYPIKYDPAKSTKAGNLAEMALAKEMQKAAGANAQTRRGHTKLRAMEVDDLALRFDFGVIGEHLSEVIHDLTHRELTLDQNRLLRDPEISQAIIGRYGRGALDQFVRTATDIATGDQPARYAIERFAKALRINNSAATFGLNLTSALMNLTGFLPALTRVGPAYMAQGVARLFGGNINNGFKFAAAKSATMRNRSQTLMREAADATRQVQPGSNIATVRNAGWYFMTQVQRVVDTVIWTGAYEQALAKAEAEGRTGPEADAQAVAIADQTVVDTQGSGRIGDLSGIERGGELAKIFTTFYSYFGVMANLQGSAIGKVYRDPANAGKWARLVTDTALIWTLPALFASLIKSVLQGDERDDEEWYKSLAREQVSYGMGMLIGLREASGLVEGHFGYSGPAGTRGVAALAKGVGEVFDGDLGKGDAKALSSTVGVFTGLPAVQVNRLIDAIAEDHAQGRDAEAVRRALFGAPRK